MDTTSYGFALAAGLVAAFNPCGFAMLPAYLTLAVIGEGGARSGRVAALSRALGATAAMTAGFLLVFGGFGLLVAPLAGAVQQHLPWVTVLIGVALVGLGGWMLAGRELTVLLPRPGRGAPTARLGSMFGYGIAYALASLSCTIGPFLAVTATTFGGGSVLAGVGVFLAYGAGMALVVGVLAVGTALAGTALAGAGLTARARRLLPHLNRIGGALLVLVGCYIGYYGVYELRLAAGADPDDPIVDGFASVQGVAAGWVDAVGVVPLLAVLAALVVGAWLLGQHRRAT